MPSTDSLAVPFTVPLCRERKHRGEKITCLTAYDFALARLFDEAGVDILLVGDSLGMVVGGLPDTLAVGMPEMLFAVRAVRRGTTRALIVADLPFGSYQASVAGGVRNAVRLLKAGAEAVKLEGARARLPLVRRLVAAEIPVMGHLGLTPQSVRRLGGFSVQGRAPEAAEALLDDALALEAAGAFALVLEGMPRELAARITARLAVPTIGIGAGPDCDGQVLVAHDLLGLTPRPPKFVRRYADLAVTVRAAAAAYCRDVTAGAFPADRESYHAPAPVPVRVRG
ncbi:MAG: 3-methyl-2-oxobutanoate hydroxymethyltransferase [Terriglobales bacterium]